MPIAHVADGYQSNAACIIQTVFGPVSNVTIRENYLEGGNFTVYLTDKGNGFGPISRARLIRNRFGRDYNHGVLALDSGPGLKIARNRWADTKELMDINDYDN